MKKILTALFVSFLISSPVQAGEKRFSAMVSDVDTGFILTAERIDSPRNPALTGRLATIAMGMQDISEKRSARDDIVQSGRIANITLKDALIATAKGSSNYRSKMTSLVNHVARTASGFSQKIDDVSDMAGLQATAMRVVRAVDGGPAFEGYTTPRDTSRLALSIIRAFPGQVSEIFGPTAHNLPGTRMWLYQDGMCLLYAKGPTSGKGFLAVLTGAPDRVKCFENAARMIKRDDSRITNARTHRYQPMTRLMQPD